MSDPALFQVDAFTSRPFAGNPAGVCLLDAAAPEEWMQSVAAEMNVAETAFLHPSPDGWNLRWFTPTVEVDLCGHATLAAAHLLYETGRAARDTTIAFNTRSGRLTASRDKTSMIWLDFPTDRVQEYPAPEGLLESLGAAPLLAARGRFDYFVLLESEEAVRRLQPDFRRLAQFPVRGVITTARSSSPEFDFVSRFFAPAAGVDEDPVTGSAHCALGPFWAERLGKENLCGCQVSRRGGAVQVRPRGSRVHLGGDAVTVFHLTFADAAVPFPKPGGNDGR